MNMFWELLKTYYEMTFLKSDFKDVLLKLPCWIYQINVMIVFQFLLKFDQVKEILRILCQIYI